MKNPLTLRNKVAIVTGAGTGIGEAIALKFGMLGARVICAGLPGDPLDDVVATLKRRQVQAYAFEGDLSNPEAAQACVDLAIKKFKKLDIVVANAGVVLVSDTTEKISDEVFQRTLDSNVRATFFISRAALPELKKTHGSLLATSSVAGLKGEPGDTIYGATKGFINAFFQGLAVEQAKNGVRVNCVLPGVTDTAMTRAARTSMTKKEELTVTDEIPMQRKGTVEEIANAFAFLASDMASYITGVLLPVDGGYTISWGGVDEVPARLRVKPKGELDRLVKHTYDGGFKKNNPDPDRKSKH